LEYKSRDHLIMTSKGIMDNSLERIRAKIAELESKLADLRITERELQALEKLPARKTRTAPGPKPKRKREANNQEDARQTIGAAIADVLGQHGALSAAEIADRIKAAGRDISNRAVSFSLQALKKRGLVKSADGRWTLPKARSRRARS
jgi:ribosomal protein L9